MSGHAQNLAELTDPGPLEAPKLRMAGMAMVVLGLIGFGLAFGVYGPERAWSAFLQGMLIPTYISVGALFFLSVHAITGAQWLLPLRRVMEGLTMPMFITAGAFLVLLVGAPYLYDWYNESLKPREDRVELYHVHHGSKGEFMVWWRFIATNAVFISAWLLIRHKFISHSLKQDLHGKSIREQQTRWAILYVMAFATGFTFLIWDLLLSLHVNWFSTMWGVYAFTSAVQTFLCVMVLLTLWLKRTHLKDHLHHHTVHDLATWMVGWSCFCAYIGFSQFMLIYYANLDEETFFYVQRTQHGYGWYLIADAILRWPLPFLGLMSQKVRTNPKALTVIAILVLCGNWIDWSWIIMPAFAHDHLRFFLDIPELLVGIGFAGGLILLALLFWKRHGLLPKGDPNLLKSINAEHLH